MYSRMKYNEGWEDDTLEDLLIETLGQLGYPVFLQGSLTEQYPESFFTYWNNESDDESFYDNEPHSILWIYDVIFYSEDPELVYCIMKDVKKKLKDNRFIVTENGNSIKSDEPTHIGRGMKVLYKQMI